MKIYKKTKVFISLVCVVALLFSALITPVVASNVKNVTATTDSSVKQGSSGECYVDIDSTESLAALEVTVHFDPERVKINSVYNSIDCTMYDSATNTDNIQFTYILDGTGTASETRLFYFTYQVLGNAQVGDAYFDITIGEAYDNDLNDVAVSGSRCKFTIAETVTSKTCSVSSTRTIETSIEQEFSLAYRLSTYEIASGSAVVTYDPELFEVVEVTNGGFLANKITDVNTDLTGSVYISFVGTEYNTKRDFVTIKFKTLKNVNEASEITFKATELCDTELNNIYCDNYITTANVVFDDTYAENAPQMKVTATYDESLKTVTAIVSLDEDSRLGAGDFVIGFDPSVLTLSSYEKGFSPSFFNINDKETAEGKLKFSIISLEDITDAQTVLTIVFNADASCAKPSAEIAISGDMLSDSLTEPILLNFIGCNVVFPVEHTYGGWSITSQPTCDVDGVLSKTCSTCGDVVTDKLSALGHNYSTEWTISVEPTCTEEGSKYTTCANCKQKVTQPIEATGHTYSTEWTIDVEPTCTETGSKSHHCVVCDDKTEVTTIEATGHTEGEWVVNKQPSAAEVGSKSKSCTVCGDVVETEEIPQILCEKPVITNVVSSETYLTLSWVSVYGADGYKLYKKTDSEWGLIADVNGETTTYVDSDVVLGTTYSYAITAYNETGESERSDEKCLLYHVHSMSEWFERTAVTCTVNGENYRQCSACDYEEIEIINAPGHNYSSDWIIDVEPGCETEGSRYKACLVCDDTVTETLEPNGHSYSSEWTIDVEATCTTAGSKSRHCSECDSKTAVTTIKATGHNYSTEWTIDVEKTCTTNGSKSHHCTLCDAKTDITVIAAGHVFEDFTTVDIERTCTESGEISRHCKYCDERTDIIETTPLGHKYENYTVIEEETCTEEGYAISTCSNCGDVKTHTIRATGHLYSNVWTIDVEATCTTAGSKSYHCIYCGDKKNITTIAMLGHSYTWTDDYEQGISIGVCGNCGDEKTEVIAIDTILTFKLNSTSTGYIVSDCIPEAVGRVVIPAIYNDLPVVEIGASAFKDCSSITSVSIPESVLKISNQAFMNCAALESASIPSSVTTMGTAVFRNCTALKNVNIPAGLKTLGSATFYGCTGLEEMIIPDGIISIGGSCFRDCSSLIKVEIPHSVSTIGNYVFYNCTSLEEVIYRGDETSWSSVSVGSNNAPLTAVSITYADFTHTMSDDAVIVEPTCVTPGSETYSCIYCGKNVSNELKPTGIHDYSTEWTIDIEPTCKTEGSKSHHCLNCDAKTDITAVDKAHKFSIEWTIDVEPTCTVDGSKSRHCVSCDEKTDVTTIAAAHNYSTEWTIDVAATCTTDGSKSRHCTACDGKTDVITIVATGHNYVLADVLSAHPHTNTYVCSYCGGERKEDAVSSSCFECKFIITLTESDSYKLIAYVGEETEVVIPSVYEGVAVAVIANSCFRGNEIITSVKISEGVTTIDSLAFMNCTSLEKVYIPASVTSIGTQAFYGFTGTIYCKSGSYAHEYAKENNIKYVLEDSQENEKPIQATEYSQIDYDNFIIRTNIYGCKDITEILDVSDSAVVITRASYMHGSLELYGSGSVITVFDGNEYIGDFVLVVDGDVNGDSVCDVLDAWQVSLASKGNTTLDGAYALAADSNDDEVVDVIDYQSIVNKAVS